MTTIRDVAEKAGVSIATVSRVFNNSCSVAADKRERVLQAIEELGYQPNGLARGLIHRRTQTIGVLIPDVSNFFFAEMFRGMEDIAHKRGWNVMVCNTDGDTQRMLNYMDVLAEKRVDGIIFTSEPISKHYYEALTKLSIPVVLAATSSEYPFPSVRVNDEQASFEAVKFLLEKGHRNIGMIAGPLDDPIAGVPRLRGFQKALEWANLTFVPEQVAHGDYRFDDGRQAAESLFRQYPGLSAIFAASDEMALGVYHYAFEKGIRIPNDLSVIGFDNVRISRMIYPPLTTVAQPMYEIGATAVARLIDTIMGTYSGESVEYLSHQIVERNSVGSLNN